MRILIIKRKSHLFFFEKLIVSEGVEIYTEDVELSVACKNVYNKNNVLPHQIANLLEKEEVGSFQVLVPLDTSNCFDTWYSEPVLRELPAFGLTAGVIDTEWVYYLSKEQRHQKFASLTGYLEGIYTPDNDPDLNISDTSLTPSGVFLEGESSVSELSPQALVVADFADYQTYDEASWLKDVTSSLDKEEITYQITSLSSDKASLEELIDLKSKVLSSEYLVTPRSYLYYLARAWGVNAIVYDSGRYVSMSFDRELCPQAALIRHKRDFTRVFSNIAADSYNTNLYVAYNESAELPDLAPNESVQPTLGHVVIWGRMPPHNYSGGRYHGWLLAEGYAALGYQVTVMTDNRPYFIDDFSHLPGHRNIHVNTTSDFLDASSYPSYTAEYVIVVPGMDRIGDMYKGAIEYADTCRAKLGLVNFESPNWFNSMVFPNRDPSLWKFWDVTSKFTSLILSTTKISLGYAQEYYLNAHQPCLFESLYAPINSAYAVRYQELINKEKRVIVFFPRHGYSAHKGWQNIVDTIGEGFRNHTVVFLCGESDLPLEVTEQLAHLATEIGFEIEYKIKINDQEKFKELARACLLLFPSQFEGYGYPPIEALAVGTPTVAFDLPVLRETCGEHLIYAPKGDWESFKHLANKALISNYRLRSDAVERAFEVASFDSFLDRLKSINSLWAATPSTKDKYVRGQVSKAFFDLNSLNSKFNSQRSKKIESKAIIKELLYGIEFNSETDTRINDSTRILITLKSTSEINVELGSNPLIDMIVHLNAKGIGVDLISEDFAVETLGDKFKFGLNRYICVGKSERVVPHLRGEVGILILKLLHQYNYLEIISVDDFLLGELKELAKVEVSPELSCFNLRNKRQISSKNSIYSYVGESEQIIGKNFISVPNSLLMSRDRKAWLVNGQCDVLTIVIEGASTELNSVLASIERMMQNLERQGVSLNVRVASKARVSSLPFFVSNVIYKNNDDLYKLLRQSMYLVNLLEGEFESYVTVMSRLVGVIVLDIEGSLAELEASIIKLSTDSDEWKKTRRTAFNDEINKVASADYYKGVFANKAFVEANFMSKFESEKATFLKDFETQQPRLYEQFKIKLDNGLVAQACEILRRYTLTSDEDLVPKCFLIRLSLLAGRLDLAESHYIELRTRYPVESIVYSMGARIKQQQKQLSSASQLDYFGLMIDSTSIESILGASQSSIKAGRNIDIEIHKMIVKNVIQLEHTEGARYFTCERQGRLYRALIQEYANDGAY